MAAMSTSSPPSRAQFDLLAARAGFTLPSPDAAALYDAFCALQSHLDRLRDPARTPADETPPMRLTLDPSGP